MTQTRTSIDDTQSTCEGTPVASPAPEAAARAGREPFYETVFHRNDWRLADAFRPLPGWGRRRFTVPVAALSGLTEYELIGEARASAPEGYRLTSLSVYPADGPERIIWSTPPDPRFAAVPAPTRHGVPA